MNSPSENDPSKLAKHRLGEVCRNLDLSARLTWILAIGEILLLVGFALALLDYWLILPVALRTVGALALTGLVLFGLVRFVRFYRRPMHLKQGALRVESQRPELGCEISTAAEYLSGERKTEHEYEPELVAALESRAAQKLNISALNSRPKLVGHVVFLGVTVLVLLMLFIVAPGALTALQRTAVPFSNAHYTQIQVHPGDIEIPVGHDVEITNVFSGRPPRDPQLHWQMSGSPQWEALALMKQTNGLFTGTLTNLQSDVTYKVTGSDAVSQDYKITTYVPPAVEELRIRVSYPTYTKLSPITQKSPDITAIRASMAELRVVPTVELSKASLRFSGLPAVGFTNESDGSWSASLNISQDADYWI